MLQSALALLFVVSLLVAGTIDRAAPIEQRQSVIDSLLSWSEAVDHYLADHCAVLIDQSDLSLAGLGQGFSPFGLAWEYAVATGATKVSVNATRAQHASVSTARALGLITTLVRAPYLVKSTVIEFDHRSIQIKSMAAEPFYASLLMYHQQQTQGVDCQ